MKIVCLSNSFRLGGRCLGGVELDHNNDPVFKNGRPKWVRPVCNTEHEQVPTHLVADISLLDIVEFQPIQETGHGHQSENVLFVTSSIQKNGSFPISKLDSITENDNFRVIFGNKGSAVPEEKVGELNYSLMLISVTTFETNERIFPNRPHPQIKLSFRHSSNSYNLPITDPTFLHKYALDNDFIQDKERIFVSLSLAALHEDWASKLVTGILYDGITSSQGISVDSSYDDLPL